MKQGQLSRPTAQLSHPKSSISANNLMETSSLFTNPAVKKHMIQSLRNGGLFRVSSKAQPVCQDQLDNQRSWIDMIDLEEKETDYFPKPILKEVVDVGNQQNIFDATLIKRSLEQQKTVRLQGLKQFSMMASKARSIPLKSETIYNHSHLPRPTALESPNSPNMHKKECFPNRLHALNRSVHLLSRRPNEQRELKSLIWPQIRDRNIHQSHKLLNKLKYRNIEFSGADCSFCPIPQSLLLRSKRLPKLAVADPPQEQSREGDLGHIPGFLMEKL